MAFFIIPVPEEVIPFDAQVELDNELFLLKFRFYTRDGLWRMTIIKAGVIILSSVKLVNTLDLLVQYNHLEELPAGKIIVSDQGLKDADPGAENFGDSVFLMYQDAAA